MKFVTIAAAAIVSAVASTASASITVSFDNVCAEKKANGWVVTGIPATLRDWNTTRAIGEAIGDGNCADGWVVNSDVDPRIVLDASSTVSTDNFTNIVDTVVDVTTEDAGRITASWQGFAPEVLRGRNNGSADKWKLIDTDGTNHTYRLVRQGNHPWPKGSTFVFTDQAIIDRDYKGGTAVVDPFYYDKLRYGASRDTTTTTDHFVAGTTVTVTYVHVSCPSVWSHDFVAPSGAIVASEQGEALPCVVKVTTGMKEVVSSRTGTDVVSVVVGDKYVTPQ